MNLLQAYAVLDIEPTIVTLEDIKAAYRAKAKLLHPDKGGDEAKFKQLVAAYELLTGKTKPKLRPRPRRQRVQWVWVHVGYTNATSTTCGAY